MSEASESIAVVSGSLFVSTVKPDGSFDQKCLFDNCQASVRPTSNQFENELLISRTGENQVELDSILPSDLVFKIHQTANFEADAERLAWSDRNQRRYNFEADDLDEVFYLNFGVAKALFRSIHSAEPGEGDAEELQTLLSPTSESKHDEMQIIERDLISVKGDLYSYDPTTSKYLVMREDITMRVDKVLVDDGQFPAYFMIIETKDGTQVFTCQIDDSINMHFDTRNLSFTWIMEVQIGDDDNESTTQLCLSIKTKSKAEVIQFRRKYSEFLLEARHQMPVADLKLTDEDHDYLESTLRDDVEPMEIEEEETEDPENERTVKDAMEADKASVNDRDDGLFNSQLAVSAATDRTFVVRGNKMGVFRTGDDGAEFRTMLKFKDPTSGTLFKPSNILLHEMDTSMIVLDPNDSTKLMRMDLERGEIVDTWSGDLTSNIPVQNIHRTSKYSNLTDTKEFVGLNKNQLLRMDPRTSEFVVQSKRYAPGTRARMNCMTTTGAGYVAVASENGDIRLFDQIGKNAKTHLPGLGPGIMGVDVSEDGHFLLATTAKYLLLIDTRIKDDQKGRSGFQKSLGKNKPTPRKLTIRNEDIARYRMGEISFTPAHFNTGSSLERSIVTSTGPFIVVWNFRSVKLGRLNSYKIKRYQDNIVADDFTYNDDGRIVVTLPNDVSVARR